MKQLVMFVLLLSALKGATQVQDNFQEAYKASLSEAGKLFSANFYSQYAHYYMLNEKKFINKIDSARGQFNSILKKYASGLEKNYAEQQQLEIKYFFDRLLIEYPTQHDNYTEKTKGNYTIPNKLKTNLLDFNKPQLLSNPDFVAYVKSYFSFLIDRKQIVLPMAIVDNHRLNASWKLTKRYFTNAECRTFWQAYFLRQHIEDNGIKGIRPIYADFIKNSTDAKAKMEITNSYKADSLGRTNHQILTYKQIGKLNLDLHLFLPKDSANKAKRPVIVFFHGGSWSEGKPDWFFDLSAAYAAKGWVAAAVEYRTYAKNSTLPFEAVKDAKAAIRWIRAHADTFFIDTAKIVAVGNSAGGHLALCTALDQKWNHANDNLSYSASPNALVINAGVYDLTDINTSWIRKDLKNKKMIEEISPNHIDSRKFPPTLILHGTADSNVPYRSAEAFVNKMKSNDVNTITFMPLQKAGHFIWFDPAFSTKVSQSRNDFLKQLWPLDVQR